MDAEESIMGKVLNFPSRDTKEAEARRLMKIADEIDSVILKHLDAGEVDPRDLAGLFAHRLGTLMRHLDQKSKLWEVCEKVLKSQAAID